MIYVGERLENFPCKGQIVNVSGFVSLSQLLQYAIVVQMLDSWKPCMLKFEFHIIFFQRCNSVTTILNSQGPYKIDGPYLACVNSWNSVIQITLVNEISIYSVTVFFFLTLNSQEQNCGNPFPLLCGCFVYEIAVIIF